MKGRALRRALATKDVVRIHADIPLLTDDTEVITPERAYELLEHNTVNRPIKWHRVEQYAEVMRAGQWKVHGQGLMLDTKGNVLTGQHRLWAVIYANVAVPMRVSRGNPPEVGSYIDRGVPQSARDLAHRTTRTVHAPSEASLARACLAIRGLLRPNTDAVAQEIVARREAFASVIAGTKGAKKTKTILMIGAALVATDRLTEISRMDGLAAQLTTALSPQTAQSCWGRGAAFCMAMQQAVRIVSGTP